MTKALFVCYWHGCWGEGLTYKISKHKFFKTLKNGKVSPHTDKRKVAINIPVIISKTDKVTFFEGNTMFEKTYLFRKNTINERALQTIPLMKVKGVLVK